MCYRLIVYLYKQKNSDFTTFQEMTEEFQKTLRHDDFIYTTDLCTTVSWVDTMVASLTHLESSKYWYTNCNNFPSLFHFYFLGCSSYSLKLRRLLLRWKSYSYKLNMTRTCSFYSLWTVSYCGHAHINFVGVSRIPGACDLGFPLNHKF